MVLPPKSDHPRILKKEPDDKERYRETDKKKSERSSVLRTESQCKRDRYTNSD